MAALTLFQRKNLILGIVDPSNSVYNIAVNNGSPVNQDEVALTFDVIPTEEDDLKNIGPTNPLETGVFVSDTIRTMPEEATFTAIISQTSLANILGIPIGAITALSDDRVADAYNYIKNNIFKAKAVFDFVSGLTVYQTFYMSAFKINRDPSTAMCLSCTFTITELNIISSQTVNAPKIPPQPVPAGNGGAPSSATPAVNQGQQATTDANPSQQGQNTQLFDTFQFLGLNTTPQIGG